jgi:hypothetical protein
MNYRSPSHGKFIKTLSFFMRSQELSVKSFDTLNMFGITYSQNWMLKAMDVAADNAMESMHQSVKTHV